MQRYTSAADAVDEEQPCGCRSLALAITSLLALPPEQPRGVLSEVARQLEPPLAALRAQADLFDLEAAQYADARAMREVAGRIVEQADLMAEWIAAILDIERIRVGKLRLDPEPVDLRTVVDEISRERSDLDIQRQTNGSAAAIILADGGRLRQALCAVLDSFAKRDSSLPIEVRLWVPQDDGANRQAFLTVSNALDNVGPDTLQPIATSIGDLHIDLYVAREIVRLIGGELWARRPRIDDCRTITIRFPLHSTSERSRDTSANRLDVHRAAVSR
jgi:K+-sensing histidine kinase KdpD